MTTAMEFSKDDDFCSSTSDLSFSNDAMSHTNMVMACRFGWAAGPLNDGQHVPLSLEAATVPNPLVSAAKESRVQRFTPCRGRLYHQLLCGHRIRTDIVEDCGPNCLNPFTVTSQLLFFCNECVKQQARRIWRDREAQHNTSYPAFEQMSQTQYEQWYDERAKLETQFAKDREVYEMELKATTRPSNSCSALEISQEDESFAAEMDALTLAMTSTEDYITSNDTSTRNNRQSLPSDTEMQLHWGLSALSLDRGSCGVEYSSHQRAYEVADQAIKSMAKDRGP